MNNKTLHQLYAEHTGKVSDKWYLYLTEYDRLLNSYRDMSISLLEIGIQNGGSLEIWSKYFNQASMLMGCDINPACAHLSFDDPRIGVIVGDANHPDVREQIVRHNPQFDIIIDDCSHMSSDIIKTFASYFPLLADGGIFIVEDMHCSYWESFEGGLFDPFSAITFFKQVTDIISYKHWGHSKMRTDLLGGFFWKYRCEISDDMLSQVHSVEFINSICIIQKKSSVDNALARHAEKIADQKYDHLLAGYRDQAIRLLEIGMKNRDSLDLWSKYFSQALMLIGCDIDSAYPNLSFDDPCIRAIAGDAKCSDVCELIARSSPQFEVIIDGGSQTASDIIQTFTLYFPLLADGGIFIIENIYASCGENFERELFNRFSAITFFNRLIDIMNHEHWGTSRARTDILQSIFTKYHCNIDIDMLSHVHSVKYVNSLCVIQKSLASDNVLGPRITAGTIELVTSGILKAHGSDIILFDQTYNPWTMRAWAEEDLANTQHELANALQDLSNTQQALADTTLALAEAEKQIGQITSSSSWRVMLPLRKTVQCVVKLVQKRG